MLIECNETLLPPRTRRAQARVNYALYFRGGNADEAPTNFDACNSPFK